MISSWQAKIQIFTDFIVINPRELLNLRLKL
jgi:hypothetical protein